MREQLSVMIYYDYQNNHYGHMGDFHTEKFHNVGIDRLNEMINTIMKLKTR